MDESGNGKLIELQDLGKANKSLIVSQDSLTRPEHTCDGIIRCPFRGSHQTPSGRCVSSPAVTTSVPCRGWGWGRHQSS